MLHTLFDKTTERSSYILGVSFSKYKPEVNGTNGTPRNTWTSPDEKLLGKVRKALRSNAKISKPNERGSRNLQIRSIYLRDRLIELGCVPNKKDREFPDYVEQPHLSHFVRGFFDGNVSCISDRMGESVLVVSYPGINFLHGLYKILVEYVGVNDGREIIRPRIFFGRKDTIRIRDFLYMDWGYIKKRELYLASKKHKFVRRANG